MRVRTDEKRRAILEAAEALFREVGYERASMAAIAAQVGGSKTTLYGYFKSKEELFAAVMTEAVEEQAERMMDLLSSRGGDLRKVLLRFGHAYLDLVLSPEILALNRLGMAEGSASGLGPALYRAGPGRGWATVMERLERWRDDGKLRFDSPAVAALHLKALLEAGMLEPRMFGAEPDLSRDEAVTSAVDAFLRAYGQPD